MPKYKTVQYIERNTIFIDLFLQVYCLIDPYQLCVQQHPSPPPAWSSLGGGWLNSLGGCEDCHRLADGAALSLGGTTLSSHRRG